MEDRDFDALPAVNPKAEQALSVPEPENTSAVPHEKQTTQALEQQPQGMVDPSQAVQQPGGQPPLPPQPPAPNPSLAVPVEPATVPANTPLIADDNDLIEKEWVERAKQIVEHTRHDPHKQNEEMTKMKLDYLKKRYGREVKESKS